MEGQIECIEGWWISRGRVPRNGNESPDFPQIPTYVKRNEANRRPRYSYPGSPNRFEYLGRLHHTVTRPSSAGEKKRDEMKRETSPIQFVSLTIGPCLR